MKYSEVVQSKPQFLRAYVVLAVVFLHTNLHSVANDAKLYGKFTLSEWQEIVKSTDFTTLGQPRYVDGLIEIISDEEAPWANRRQAGKTLGRIGKPAAKAVPVLKEILQNSADDSISRKLWVLSSLSLFKNVAKEVTPDVSDIVLDDTEPHLIRVNALETLGRVGQESQLTLSTFATILNKDSSKIDTERNELRLAASEAVWILGPTATPLLPLLVQNAGDEWSAIRLASINAIGAIGPQAEIAISTLVDTLLFDEVEAVKEISADALGKIGSPAIPVLGQLLSDPEERVRLYVIQALTKMSYNTQVSALLKNALQDNSDIVKVYAATALLRQKPDEQKAQELLLQFLDHPIRQVRLESYNAISSQISTSESLRTAVIKFIETPTSGKTATAAAKKILRKFEFDQM